MLSAFQERIARIFLSAPEARHFALAGGGALVFKGEVQRRTHDLDFFVPLAEEVRAVAERFKALLAQEGLAFEVMRSSPAFVRMVVRAPDGEEVLVDIGYDFRLREPDLSPIGPVLSSEELAADKLLALFGRAEARDFVDVFTLAQKFGIEAMLGWAKEKDPGFDPYVLAVMIGGMDRHPRAEFDIDDPSFEAMRDFFAALRASLIRQSLGR